MGFYIHLPWELLCYGKEPCLMPNGFFTTKLCTKATVCTWQTVFWEPGWFCAFDVGEKQKGFRPRALTFSKTACRSGGSIWKSRATVCPLACLEGSDVTCSLTCGHFASATHASFSHFTSALISGDTQN